MTNFRQASSLGRPHERSASAVAAIRPRGERNGLHRCERLDATPLNESTINAIGLRISAVGDLRMEGHFDLSQCGKAGFDHQVEPRGNGPTIRPRDYCSRPATYARIRIA